MITALYVLPLIMLWLFAFIRIIRLRQSKKIGLGEGGDPELRQATRAYGNFTEVVPLGILIMLLLEVQDAPVWALHVYGAGLFISRAAHMQGLIQSGGLSAGRTAGTLGTLALLSLGALGLFYLAL